MQNFAQTREELESERFLIINDIEITNKSLNKLTQSKASSIAELQKLENLIETKNKLILNIRTELNLIDEDLVNLENKRSIHNTSLDLLINEYGNLAFVNYKNQLVKSKWAVLLNSENLKDALVSWRYFKQLEKYISDQLQNIKKETSNLVMTDQDISQENIQKHDLLEKEKILLEDIEKQAEEADSIIKKLDKDEVILRANLNDQKNKREELNQAIQNNIIKSFNSKIRDKSDREEVNSFELNKGIHNWPVNGGEIKLHFGRQAHPLYPEIPIDNNGIDIVSFSDSYAKCIASGRVLKIETLNPGEKTIIVAHNQNYFSVYSHLNQVFVKENEYLDENHKLATLHKTREGSYKLHFEILQGQENLNPEQWLKKK